MSYIGNSPGVASQRVVTEEVISGSSKTDFYPVGGYALGYVDVLVNGIEIDSSDFTANDGQLVRLSLAAQVGDTVKIKCFIPRGLSDGYTKAEADARHVLKSGDTMTGMLKVSADGSANSYQGQVRVLPEVNAAGQWGGITLPDSSSGASNSNQYWMIGRGNMISDRRMTIHMPSYADYGGTGYVPTFQICSTGDYKTLVADANGCVTKPRQPVFMAFGSLSTGQGAGVAAFNNTRLNIGSYFNTVTYRFTAPITGNYSFTLYGLMGPNSSGQAVVTLRKNGGIIATMHRNDTASLTWEQGSVTCITPMSAGDYVDVNIADGTLYMDNVGCYTGFSGQLLS